MKKTDYGRSIKHSKSYQEIALKKSGVKENMSDLNICEENISLYISYFVLQHVESANLYAERCVISGSDKLPDNSRKYLGSLEPIFNEMGIFEALKKHHNLSVDSLSHSVNEYQNPFTLNKSQLNDQLLNTKDDSDFEVYSKSAFWSNRLTKALQDMKIGLVFSKTHDVAKCGSYDKALGSICNSCYGEIKEDCTMGESFLGDYSSYIFGDITFDELTDGEGYKFVKELLDSKSGKADISVEDTYKYMALDTSISSLYLYKSIFTELAVDEQIKNGDLPAIIYKAEDKSRENNYFNSTINIAIQGYNAPISLHFGEDFITKLEDKRENKFEKFENIVNLEQGLVLYDYGEEQKEQIKSLNSPRVYLNTKQQTLVEFTNKMLNSPGQIMQNGNMER